MQRALQPGRAGLASAGSTLRQLAARLAPGAPSGGGAAAAAAARPFGGSAPRAAGRSRLRGAPVAHARRALRELLDEQDEEREEDDNVPIGALLAGARAAAARARPLSSPPPPPSTHTPLHLLRAAFASVLSPCHPPPRSDPAAVGLAPPSRAVPRPAPARAKRPGGRLRRLAAAAGGGDVCGDVRVSAHTPQSEMMYADTIHRAPSGWWLADCPKPRCAGRPARRFFSQFFFFFFFFFF